MIQMKTYTENFENIYAEKVCSCVDGKLKGDLVQSMHQYFPGSFFRKKATAEELFRKLILSGYEDLKKIYIHICNKAMARMRQACFDPADGSKMRYPYGDYCKKYDFVRNLRVHKQKMNVRIVHESGMLVCPYCNRDYINSRGDGASGAQLDHFYSKSRFPFFALCLYNLVPVCAVCNHIKSDSAAELVSPFEASLILDKELTFGYTLEEPQKYDAIQVQIDCSARMERNVSALKLKEAYSIHNDEVRELIRKYDIYTASQLEENYELLDSAGIKITREEMKYMVFGRPAAPEHYGRIPLSKLRHDIMEKLKIYQN